MCGIVGQLGRWPGDEARWLSAAIEALHHRGPDDGGHWSDPSAGIQLGHRRLSIIDLSEGGHQPFESSDGRFVLVFNGEIYNHGSLRSELERSGHSFRSSSDTEVLLVSIQRWGLVGALQRANGMFALAVWDRRERVLGLARDRLGEKPLFLQRGPNGAVRFASELKALRAGGAPAPAVDRRALTTYLRLGYVPAPHSIYEGTSKVRPGTVRWISADRDEEEVYWRPPDTGPTSRDTGDLVELDALLHESVALRMVADVPVGAFLSGGIDSSLVTALMAAQGGTVRTFTIGFEQAEFDESPDATRIAAHLGTDHTTMVVSDGEARAVVPRLPHMFDEPFADQSAIPTSLVAELARRHVTVALSGDGGDELFGGYTRYRRLALGAPLAFLPQFVPDLLIAGSRRLGTHHRFAARARTLERVGMGIQHRGTHGLYKSLVSLWENPGEVVPGGEELPNALTDDTAWPVRPQRLVRRAMAADLVTYLPDDLLVKLDRTSMAVSLEARVPLLDHRIVEWSRRYGHPDVFSESGMKAPLRAILERHVPRELFDRPKMGFGAPMGAWLRGPLRSWADELLEPDALADGGLLRPEPIVERWRSHLSGATDQSYPLWAVLAFQAWREAWC